jgi:hypothetical protein
MPDELRPYSRSDYNRALVLNALTQPFNVLLLASVAIAGLLLDVFLPVLAVGLVIYGIAAARTYLDDEEAQKVLTRERAKRRAGGRAARPGSAGAADSGTPPRRPPARGAHPRCGRPGAAGRSAATPRRPS